MFVAVVVWAGWLFGYRQGVTGTTPGKRRLGIRLIDIETGEPYVRPLMRFFKDRMRRRR